MENIAASPLTIWAIKFREHKALASITLHGILSLRDLPDVAQQAAFDAIHSSVIAAIPRQMAGRLTVMDNHGNQYGELGCTTPSGYITAQNIDSREMQSYRGATCPRYVCTVLKDGIPVIDCSTEEIALDYICAIEGLNDVMRHILASHEILKTTWSEYELIPYGAEHRTAWQLREVRKPIGALQS